MIHVWHVRDGRITEFWDTYLDAAAEDAFWNTALTQQPSNPADRRGWCPDNWRHGRRVERDRVFPT